MIANSFMFLGALWCSGGSGISFSSYADCCVEKTLTWETTGLGSHSSEVPRLTAPTSPRNATESDAWG